jgi:serine protease Do
MAAEVVGINTAIIASGQGIGFAVPINMARNVITQLKRHGEVTRGWLGVAIQDISPELADYYGLSEKDAGVLVTEVFKGDPADAAGIQPKDVIISVNGQKVEATRELTRIIANIGVGDRATVSVIRDGRQKTFIVEIAKREEERIAARGSGPEEDDQLGIRVEEISPDIARRFDMKDDRGVIVADIAQGSKGDQAGIRPGDIVKEINHHPIRSVEDYAQGIDKVKEGEEIQFFIRRTGMGFLVVKLIK